MIWSSKYLNLKFDDIKERITAPGIEIIESNILIQSLFSLKFWR